VIAHQRKLQAAVPAYLGTTTVLGWRYTVRELQPMEAKLDLETIKPGELDALCAACGTVLGRLHRRGNMDLPARLDGRDRALSRRVAAFALRYVWARTRRDSAPAGQKWSARSGCEAHPLAPARN
jgi:hypothetical protein